MNVLASPDGGSGPLRVRITDATGQPVNTYDTTHDRQLHLFALRDSQPAGVRDAREGASRFSEFQHVHPRFLGDGTWQLDNFSPKSGGAIRLIADFQTSGQKAQPQSMLNLAPDAAAAEGNDAGGLTATPQPDNAGGHAFRVATETGDPLTETEPLLGAAGHLALFDTGSTGSRVNMVHTHPTGEFTNGELSFMTETEPGSTYQGWLQVKPSGREPAAIPVTLTGAEPIKSTSATTSPPPVSPAPPQPIAPAAPAPVTAPAPAPTHAPTPIPVVPAADDAHAADTPAHGH